MATSFVSTNLQTQSYRTEVKPAIYTCSCGQRATYRAYNGFTGASYNVCPDGRELHALGMRHAAEDEAGWFVTISTGRKVWATDMEGK